MRRILVLLVAVLVGLGGVVGSAAGEEEGLAGAVATFVGSVTLVTGDHVTVRRVGGRLVPAVDPGPGRAGMQFATAVHGDALDVVPGDAWGFLGSGYLDRRLFDVAGLIRDGFGDERRDDLPLILPASAPGAGIVLSTVDVKTLSLPKADAVDFWEGMVRNRAAGRVWLDGVRKPSLDESVPQIGAPTAWKSGWTGKGVQVAVLDSGIDGTHPDLRRKIAAAKDFTGEGKETEDTDGHGTHVASTIAGTGAASQGRYTGVAPDARLLVGKVCGGSGCAESAILAGIQWAVDSGAKIVNLSLGGPDTADVDPIEAAIDRLSDRALFVVAAGNDGGYGAETVSSPASADGALAVGAVDKSDRLAGFSGQGPRVHDAAVKPEIVAPGVDITAARSKYSSLGKKGDRYTSLSGTSMAAPHVAGTAALLVQRHPDWPAPRLKAALVAAAKRLDGPGAFQQGAGRVDAARVVGQVGYTEPAVVSVGRQAWPHEDDPVVTKQLTYVNTATVPLVLRLSLAGNAPAGMFRLSTQDVTVPPAGRSTVDVVTDTKVSAPDATYSAWVVAEGGVERITTPVAVDRESESYDLTVHTIDPSGAPSDSNFTLLWGVSADRYRPLPTIAGADTVRVRKGTYHLDTVISAPLPDGRIASHKVVQPTVEVTRDTSVTLDAALAKPITIDFSHPGVRSQTVGTGYGRRLPWGTLYASVLGDSFERIFTAQLGGPIPNVSADVGGGFYIPDPTGGVNQAPITYNVAWFQAGELPTGFSRHVDDTDLARVDSTYRQVQAQRNGTKLWLVTNPTFQSGSGFGLPMTLPTSRTEFHGGDGTWSAEFDQWRQTRKQTITEFTSTTDTLDQVPGQTYREDWNTATFGPAVPRTGLAVRVNDQISFGVPLFTDSLSRMAQSPVKSGSSELYREGVLIGQSTQPGQGVFDVPPEKANYRLETKAVRDAPLSTEVRCAWTFDSIRPQSFKGGALLPLMGVRFAPENLDPRNHATTRTVRVPVTVRRQPQAPTAPLASLTVAASFDDGQTWVDVPVADGAATVTSPKGTRFVSLRAKAVDTAGTSIEQTVIRAYGA
ncbi:S8 family peptidase [Actinokineospora enzanensis]|uniref:S8 family peptidase n=1 Tax=Actinokineospora enzanensis TaxID=155975 RepID=UPI000364C31A|nr:S8 family serine peptidase [Actinokineospora enzanensis]